MREPCGNCDTEDEVQLAGKENKEELMMRDDANLQEIGRLAKECQLLAKENEEKEELKELNKQHLEEILKLRKEQDIMGEGKKSKEEELRSLKDGPRSIWGELPAGQ
ncbi:hypothetical protein ACLOJK_013595 [Asimina triloba]